MDELFAQKITGLVGRQIVLQTQLRWVEPQARTTVSDSADIRSKPAGATVVFENYYRCVGIKRLRGDPWRGEFAVVSPKLTHERAKDGSDQFTFDGRALSNQRKAHALKGRLQYRAWLLGDRSVTRSQANFTQRFQNQSNDPAYWSQTFEFVLDDILE